MLDPSGIFGYAFGEPFDHQGPPFSGTHKLPDLPLTERLMELERWAIDLFKANEITDAYIEEPFLGKHLNFTSVSTQIGYSLIAGIAARKCRVKVSTLPNSTWRSELGLPTRGPKNVLAHPDYARFKSRKSGQKDAQRQWVKDRAMDYARQHGSNPADDNEGDAICMYHWKANRLRAKRAEIGQRRDLFDDLAI